MRKSAIIVCAAVFFALAGAASAARPENPVVLHQAQGMDQQAEAGYFQIPLHRVRSQCAVGVHGNYGCTYGVCIMRHISPVVGLGVHIAFAIPSRAWWVGHDAIIHRHGRWHVAMGGWTSPRSAC